jgi:hypothetical protein
MNRKEIEKKAKSSEESISDYMLRTRNIEFEDGSRTEVVHFGHSERITNYEPNSSAREILCMTNSLMHALMGPSRVIYDNSGRTVLLEFHSEGMLGRDEDEPSRVTYDYDKCTVTKSYYRLGKLSRDPSKGWALITKTIPRETADDDYENSEEDFVETVCSKEAWVDGERAIRKGVSSKYYSDGKCVKKCVYDHERIVELWSLSGQYWVVVKNPKINDEKKIISEDQSSKGLPRAEDMKGFVSGVPINGIFYVNSSIGVEMQLYRNIKIAARVGRSDASAWCSNPSIADCVTAIAKSKGYKVKPGLADNLVKIGW